MTSYENFLNGCYDAVVEIKNEGELNKFMNLMEDLGWKLYTSWLRRLNDHYGVFLGARTDGIKDICLEFQWGKGFTYGDKQQYLKNCEGTQVLSLEELFTSVGKEF